MNKIVIITALCGNRDILSDPSIVHQNVDYVAFVDKIYPCKIWKQILTTNFTFDGQFSNRRNAKIYKIIPHLFLHDYDYYFWVDATHDVVKNPYELCDTYLKDSDIAVFKHTARNCVYVEANEIKRLKYDTDENLTRQMDFYRHSGYPENNGLYELPAFIRKSSELVNCFNLKWWEQICRFSSRDQLSFPYCVHTLGLKLCILSGYANGINPTTGVIGNNDLIPQRRNHV